MVSWAAPDGGSGRFGEWIAGARWPSNCCIAITKWRAWQRRGALLRASPAPGLHFEAADSAARPYVFGMAQPVFHAPDHDHERCSADALAHAEALCAQRSQRLTPIRRQVLEVLLESHKPLGAYEIMDRAATRRGRLAPSGEKLAPSGVRPAPITI